MGSHPKWDTDSGVGWLSPCPETGVTPWWDTGSAVRGGGGNVKIFAITFALLSYVAFLP